MTGLPAIHQVAWIVADLDASVAQMQKMMGWGPWKVYDYAAPRLHDLAVRGEPAEFSWTGAETEIAAGSYVELLQPVVAEIVKVTHMWLEIRPLPRRRAEYVLMTPRSASNAPVRGKAR